MNKVRLSRTGVQRYFELRDWCSDQFGPEALVVDNFIPLSGRWFLISTNVYYDFYFGTAEDATLFKLTWT